MSNLQDFNINWQEVEESSFAPLPNGQYAAKISDSVISDNKDRTGKNLKLTYTLLGKKGVKGRKVFDYFVISHNESAKAQNGLGKLKRLLKTLDDFKFEELTDTSILHGKLVGLELEVESSEKFGDQNRVKKFLAYDESLIEG